MSEPGQLWTLADALDSLELRSVGDDRFEATGRAMAGGGWIYGGLLAGQAVLAALATTDKPQVRSLHVAYQRRGDPTRPVEIRVDRAGDAPHLRHAPRPPGTGR